MNLGALIAREANVQPDHVMLLRHSNSKTRRLLQFGATIEEYTLVQPTDTKYDFLADRRPAIQIVVAIVEDHVRSVYRIMGIKRTGTTRTLVSENFRQFDIALGYPELPARLFIGVPFSSTSLGLPVRGWTSPRNPVARSGGSLFDTVEVVLAH